MAAGEEAKKTVGGEGSGFKSGGEPPHSKVGLPGTLLASGGGLRVICGRGSVLELTSVKLEGRKEVTAAEFARGARLRASERLGKV